MAKKSAGGMNKSAEIRAFKDANPGMGPTAISEALKKDKGLDVTPAFVSTVLSNAKGPGAAKGKKGRRKKKGGKKVGRKAAAAPVASGAGELSVDHLVKAKKLAEQMGGVAEAKAALDALSKIVE